MGTKTMDVVVKPGRTLVTGQAQKGEDGKPARPKITRHGPGAELRLDDAEAKRLIALGVVARRGTDEAKAAKAAADQLPKDFPGHDALAKNGIESYSALATLDKEALIALDGIGEATAAQILEARDARRK